MMAAEIERGRSHTEMRGDVSGQNWRDPSAEIAERVHQTGKGSGEFLRHINAGGPKNLATANILKPSAGREQCDGEPLICGGACRTKENPAEARHSNPNGELTSSAFAEFARRCVGKFPPSGARTAIAR